MSGPACQCGRPAKPVEGVYLERLYPGEFSCAGCGRRTAFCSCGGVVPLPRPVHVPVLDGFAVRRARAGWRARAIMAAAGVSRRTAYRYLEAKRTEDIRVGDHVATFVIRDGRLPARISEWREA